MSLVTVETLFEISFAEFARMKLEAEGIPVLMHSMGQASLWGASTLGGIRVQVPKEFAERAAIVLKQLREDLNGK
jgi:hypothetical protein